VTNIEIKACKKSASLQGFDEAYREEARVRKTTKLANSDIAAPRAPWNVRGRPAWANRDQVKTSRQSSHR